MEQLLQLVIIWSFSLSVSSRHFCMSHVFVCHDRAISYRAIEFMSSCQLTLSMRCDINKKLCVLRSHSELCVEHVCFTLPACWALVLSLRS